MASAGAIVEKRCLRSVTGPAAVLCLALHDSGVVYAAFSDQTIGAWRIADWSCTRVFEGHSNWVRALACSPDGRVLYSGSADNTVRSWNTADGVTLHTFTGHGDSVTALALAADGGVLYSGSYDFTVRTWRAATGDPLAVHEGHVDWVLTLALAPDGRLFSGSRDKTVREWIAGSAGRVLGGHAAGVTSLTVSGDGRTLFAGCEDGAIVACDGSTGERLYALEGHTDVVTALAVTPDGSQLFSGSKDATARSWSLAARAAVRMFVGHGDALTALLLVGPGGGEGRLLTAARDKCIKAWQLADFSAQLRDNLLAGDRQGAAAAVAAGALQPWPADWLAGCTWPDAARAQRLLADVLGDTQRAVTSENTARAAALRAAADAAGRAAAEAEAAAAAASGVTVASVREVERILAELKVAEAAVASAIAAEEEARSLASVAAATYTAATAAAEGGGKWGTGASAETVELLGERAKEADTNAAALEDRAREWRSRVEGGRLASLSGDDVGEVLREIGMAPFEPVFARNRINGEALAAMSDDVLRSADLGLSLVQRKRLLRAAHCLAVGCWPLEPCGELTASRCSGWGKVEVEAWLQSLGMERHVGAFEEHRLAGWVLADLCDGDLKEIGIEAVGDRVILGRHIAALGGSASASAQPLSPENASPPGAGGTASTAVPGAGPATGVGLTGGALGATAVVTYPQQSIPAGSGATGFITTAHLPPGLRQLTYAVLEAATNGFAAEAKIGTGSSGVVYEAQLPQLGGAHVAIKRLTGAGFNQDAQFLQELAIPSMCRHEHLLPLLAASVDGPYVCLIYPLMAGGSLQQRLTGTDARHKPVPPLTAMDRLRLAISVCMAVLHLHTPTADRPVVLHRDIKPANILLDEGLNARVSDFGLARLAPTLGGGAEGETHIATRLMGTVGYIDPEYAQSGRMDESSDGYSVGTVILQLLTGMPSHDPDAAVPNLAYRLRRDLRPDRAEGIADKAAGTWPEGLAPALATAAAGLLRQRRQDRMALRDALQLLQVAAEELHHLQPLEEHDGTGGAGSLNARAMAAAAEDVSAPGGGGDPGGPPGRVGAGSAEGGSGGEDGDGGDGDGLGAEQRGGRQRSSGHGPRNSPGLKRSVSVPHRLHRHTYSVDSSDSIDSLLVATEVEESTTFNTFQGHAANVCGLALAASGDVLYSASEDKSIRAWCVADGSCTAVLTGHAHRVTALLLSPDGATLYSGSGDHTIRLWRVADGAHVGTLEGHSDWVGAMVISADGRWLYSGSGDRTIRAWDLTAGGVCVAALHGHSDWVRALAISRDGTTLFSGAGDSHIKAWSVQEDALRAAAAAAADAAIAVPLAGGAVPTAPVDVDASIATLSGHVDWVLALALASDAARLFSGSRDKSIRAWRVMDGTCLLTFEGHTRLVTSLALARGDAVLYSGSGDHTIRAWRTDDGSCLTCYQGHWDWVSCLVLSLDGAALYSGSEDKYIRKWRVGDAQHAGGDSGPVRFVGTGGPEEVRTYTLSTAETVAECIMCFGRREVRFSCGHAVLCGACAALLRARGNRCPICRSAITSVAPIGGGEGSYVASAVVVVP